MIGDFRGTANICDCWQQRILNHGTQQSVRAELFGMMVPSLKGFFDRFLNVSGNEAPIFRANGDALAVDDAKNQSAVLGDLDLGVKSGALKRRGSRHEFFRESFVLL